MACGRSRRPSASVDGPAEVRIETPRTLLRLGREDDAPALLAYFVRNRAYHKQWEPPLSDAFFTLASQRMLMRRRAAEYAEGRSACLLIFNRANRDGAVIGRLNFSEIVRGPFQACFLGYAVDHEYEGRGYMSESLRAAVNWAFTELRLHRIMANYRPENARSGRLLERLGFEREGFAREYLFVDGAWRDHVLTALTTPDAQLVDV
jgi:ribosomal-protein-alanine N-acetyltransferase